MQSDRCVIRHALLCTFLAAVTGLAAGQGACAPADLLEWVPRVSLPPPFQFNGQAGSYDKTLCFPEPVVIRAFPIDIDEASFWATYNGLTTFLSVFPHRDSTQVSWVLRDTSGSGSTLIDRQCREAITADGDTAIFYPGWRIVRGSTVTFTLAVRVDDGFFTTSTGPSPAGGFDDPAVQRADCTANLPELTVMITHNMDGTYRVQISPPPGYCNQVPPLPPPVGPTGALCGCNLLSPQPANSQSGYRLTALASGPSDGFICAETPSPIWGDVKDFDRKRWDCGGANAIEYDCRDSVRYAWTLTAQSGGFVSEAGTSFGSGTTTATAQQPVCWVPTISTTMTLRANLGGDDGMPPWYGGTGTWPNFDDPTAAAPQVVLDVLPCVDIRVDSNNDGSITQADDGMEECSPGNLVALNDNDENVNGVSDLDDVNNLVGSGNSGGRFPDILAV